MIKTAVATAMPESTAISMSELGHQADPEKNGDEDPVFRSRAVHSFPDRPEDQGQGKERHGRIDMDRVE
jgi:hypothetical protein